MRALRRAVLIAGPTASGKSRLALDKARELGGVIVNADAMQVYGVLRVLTARPAAEEMEGVPHLLYGAVEPAVRFSTGAWLAAVEELIQATERDGGPLVFAGGTGLYFEALTKGIAPVPAIPQEAVAEAERELEGLDAAGRAQVLAERDPQMAGRIQAADPQRVARALAVLSETGRSLASFQAGDHAPPLAGFEIERIVLNPEREMLRQRIAERFECMLEEGALGEVEALREMKLDPSLPAMKAIGVREIGAMLDGLISREAAVEQAVTATRQYAKRQRTWMRNRMADWTWIGPAG